MTLYGNDLIESIGNIEKAKDLLARIKSDENYDQKLVDKYATMFAYSYNNGELRVTKYQTIIRNKRYTPVVILENAIKDSQNDV